MSARIRTGYAFRHAAGKLVDVVERLNQLNYQRLPITDTASTYGWIKWNAMAQLCGKAPVFGVELAVSPDPAAKKPIVDYWTFVARDSVVPLHRLIGVATEQFRYEPLLTIDQAAGAASAVNVIMGHRAPVESIQARPGLWFGLGPATTPFLVNRALRHWHPPVAVCNNRFPGEQDRPLYELVCGRHAGTQSYAQHILSDEEWVEYVRNLSIDKPLSVAADAIENRDDIWRQSTATLPRATMIKPARPLTLQELCAAGAKRIGLWPFEIAYYDRLQRELELIEAKGFEDYFHLVADLVTWARQHMLVGPARGSSCGSLVCYLLGITTVDPIPYGLLFERFIDVGRDDLPDIDIDFSDQHRELIFDYVRERYGAHRVARLGTVNMFQARSALKEVALALDIPVWATSAIADQAEKSSLPVTIKQSPLLQQYPEIGYTINLEDHPRHAGQHAAGVVITEGPVTDVVAVNQRTGATMCDKYDAEAIGLLKIDALGLTQLSIFEDTLELAGKPRNTLDCVDFRDLKAFHILNLHRYAGVFQFNGPALQGLCNKVTVTSLDDIVALTALARPGPLDSGEAARWIDVKTGKTKPNYPDKSIEHILKPTLGVVIYQEQVMNICRAFGMSWEEVSALRRLISKSAGPEALDPYFEAFATGGKKAGIDAHVVRELWGILRASGAYSFNKSHAVAYAIISYWCCWLKAYYPLEYAAAALTHAGEDMQLKLLRELAREGTRYVPADPKHSTDKWTVVNKDGHRTLIGPLSNIIGIGPQHMRTILSQRARPQVERLPDHVGKVLARMRTKIDDLWPIKSAIERLMTDDLRADLVSPRLDVIDVQSKGQPYVIRVEGLIDSIRKVDENSSERVAKRQGRELPAGSQSLNLWIGDDTDKIFAKVDWEAFAELGEEILQHGKGYYSIRGTVPPNFRMISVEKFRFIGQEGAIDAKNIAAE